MYDALMNFLPPSVRVTVEGVMLVLHCGLLVLGILVLYNIYCDPIDDEDEYE